MNALDFQSDYARNLREFQKQLPVPKGILLVSAHWVTVGTQVAATEKPKTIHDFYGFPPALFQVEYPAPGGPEIAYQVHLIVKSCGIWVDMDYGLDHGAWSVLRHLYPDANIPVAQLSIDENKSPAEHWMLARELSILRDHGILIIGSGNIVHNLTRADFRNRNAAPPDWALQFDERIANAINEKKEESLLSYLNPDTATRFSVPTSEHYIPLLYVMGTARPSESITTIHAGFEHGSISMRSVAVG